MAAITLDIIKNKRKQNKTNKQEQENGCGSDSCEWMIVKKYK